MTRGRTAAVTLALAVAIAAVATTTPVRADDGDDDSNYDPASTAWNGLASFVGLAGGMGYEVRPMAALVFVRWQSLD